MFSPFFLVSFKAIKNCIIISEFFDLVNSRKEGENFHILSYMPNSDRLNI